MYGTQGMIENITEYLSQVNDTYNNTNGEAELTRQADDSIIAVFSNGAGCIFNLTAGILNFVLSLPPSFLGQTRGLLGNNNGDKTDDFIKRGELQHLPDSLTEEQIYEFGKTCKQH